MNHRKKPLNLRYSYAARSQITGAMQVFAVNPDEPDRTISVMLTPEQVRHLKVFLMDEKRLNT